MVTVRLRRCIHRVTAGVGVAGLLSSLLVAIVGGALNAPAAHASPLSSVTEFQPTIPTKFGGRSISVSINPGNTSQVIVATESGGLFLSSDDGANWSHVDSFPLHRMSDVKWSPNNPSLIVATTWRSNDTLNPGGVWRTTDAGVTWQHSTTPAACGADFNGWGIDFEPSSNVVYAGSDCGLLLSTDGGATFTQTFIPGWTHAVVARAGGQVDVCSDDGHRRFTRSGSTLTLVNGPNAFPAVGPGASAGGCPQRNGGIAAAAHDLAGVPQEPGVLFVMKGGTSTSACGGTTTNPAGLWFLFESDDNGVNWTQIGGACPSRAPWVQTNRSSDGNPNHFDIYYSGGLDVYRATCTSGGPGLRCTGLPAIGSPNVTTAHADDSTVAFIPDGTNCARFIVNDGGVEKSTDCGATFAMAAGSGAGNGNFNGLQAYEVSGQVHPGGPSDYVFGTQDNSIYGSADSGATWPNVDCCEGFNFQEPHSSPGPTGRLTYVTCGPCTNRTADTHLGGPSNWSNPSSGTVLAPDTGSPYLLRPTTDTYVQWTSDSAGNNNLNLTTNAGSSWTAVSGATTSSALMGHVYVSGPASDPTLYQPVCTSNCGFVAPSGALLKITGVNTGGTVNLTTLGGGLGALGAYNDGNGSWRLQEAAFGVDPNNPLHMIAADVQSNTMKQSVDGGATWQTDTQLTSLVTKNNRFAFSDPTGRLGTQAHAIYFDPTNGQRIFVGTESAGIIVSGDGGQSWIPIPGSDQIPAVTSFFVDEVQNRILVSSYGRGLWTLTIPTADLSISKTHTPDPVIAGSQLTWHIKVTNNGPDPAPDATVTDTLPPGDTYLTNNLNPPAGCSAAGQVVTCSIGGVANGQTVSFDIVTLVGPNTVAAAGSPTNITNSAVVSSSTVVDPNSANNTAQDTAIVNDSADLAVAKLCKPDTTVYAGTPINCTVFVDNYGPSYARNVVIDDTGLSNGSFTISNVTVSPGPTICTISNVTGGQNISCDAGNLAPASTTQPGRVTLTYTLTATEGQDIDNKASVRSDTPDPNSANNSTEVNLTVTSLADLALTMNGPGAVVAGTPISWTLSVANNGPSTANNVAITDTMPAGVTITGVSMPGASCSSGLAGDPTQPAVCTFGSLAPGATSSIMKINATVNARTTGILQNDARVSSNTFDNNSSNDLAHQETSVTVQSSLSVAVASTPNPVIAGTPLSYQITVSNGGPSTATAITLTDPLPTGVTFSSTGGVGTCGYQTNTNTTTCQLPNLDPGQNDVVFIYTNVKPSTSPGPMTNSATATGTGSANVTGSVTTNVQTQADLAITLSSDANVYHPSTTIHYQITVNNLGPSDAQNLIITQALPMVKQGKYISNNFGCPAPSGTTLTCSYTSVPALVTIPAGGSITFQVNFFITGNKGLITSTVSVTSATTDPIPSNNSSTRNVTVK
jgi:uncharacterized repeat protein (TIGR01451 family)